MAANSSSLTDTSEEECDEPYPHFDETQRYQSDKHTNKPASSGDLSEEDYDEPRAKIMRSNMFIRPLQSDSASNRPVASNGSTQLESDGNVGSTMNLNMYKNDDKAYLEIDAAVYGEKIQKMMSNMKYEGGGLGKLEQGRISPIKASTQKGRTGLGFHHHVGELPSGVAYNPTSDDADANEKPSWMPEPPLTELNSDMLENWVVEGPIKEIIDDETTFCNPVTLHHILKSKSAFNSLNDKQLREARARANPYETIGSAFFINRAAVKMANMDAVFDFMFTIPKDQSGKEIINNNTLLYFADVCAGPGGFSEYVLWKKKWRAKGFGFTLTGANDFKLSEFRAGPTETFTAYYGSAEDGDIMNPHNLESLKDYVFKYTDNLGVHFLMADGGFSVQNKENIQEILSKKLYLCQCIAGLLLVRTGGHVIVKLFDIFTPFSVGLIYLMYRSFEKVCIHKPRTSRPANSERYLICKWKKVDSDLIGHHLFRVNQKLWEAKNSNTDVVQLVPLKVIMEDKHFFNYIYNSNNSLGTQQLQALLKIVIFIKNKELAEKRQKDIREKCLTLWQLPDEQRKEPIQWNMESMMQNVITLLKAHYPCTLDSLSFKKQPPNMLNTIKDLTNKISNIYDWFFVFVDHSKISNCGHGVVFLGLGGPNITEIPAQADMWSTDSTTFSLPALTVAWGEKVREFKGQGKGQLRKTVIQLVDALIIGGEPVAHLHLVERHKQLELMCSALDNGQNSVRCKRLWSLEEAEYALSTLETRQMKNMCDAYVTILSDQVEPTSETRQMKNMCHEKVTILSNQVKLHNLQPYFPVGGMLLIKATQDPWQCRISKQHNMKYFWSPGKSSKFWKDRPLQANKHFLESYQERLLWRWEPPSSVLNTKTTPPEDEHDCDSEKTLLQYSFFKFLRHNM